MAGFDFLTGVVVVEVAQYGPDALGGFLADLGASVIKVESIDGGDPIRRSGNSGIGGSDGRGLLHTRWNRGKQSVALDLKAPDGADVFRCLVADADVVVEGMRAGVLSRLGLGPDDLRSVNPRLVFCTLTGLGSGGPYSSMGSQGPSFDAFGGLLTRASAGGDLGAMKVPVGMYAMGLYAAMATIAAVRSAERTGEGAVLEIAAADCAAHWLPTAVDEVLNQRLLVERPGVASEDGRMSKWSRIHPYLTSDGAVLFQGYYDKFWHRFCEAVDRPDLPLLHSGGLDPVVADDRVFDELTQLFVTRATVEWMHLFLEHDVPGVPVNTPDELAIDPHFVARDNIYDVVDEAGNALRLTGTPIKVAGQTFAPDLAPTFAADTDSVLAASGFEASDIELLRSRGVIA